MTLISIYGSDARDLQLRQIKGYYQFGDIKTCSNEKTFKCVKNNKKAPL